jgi:hypothetical protein
MRSRRIERNIPHFHHETSPAPLYKIKDLMFESAGLYCGMKEDSKYVFIRMARVEEAQIAVFDLVQKSFEQQALS